VCSSDLGFEDSYWSGRRPGGFYIPRFQNLSDGDAQEDYVRGYGVQGGASRANWSRATDQPGVGADFKESLRQPSGWSMRLHAFGEMLPNPDNRVTLHPTLKDKWGIPLVHIDCTLGSNDIALAERAGQDLHDMLAQTGFENIVSGGEPYAPGYGIHEMGTARMGRDPATSVLNGWNQAHDAPNVFMTDGACMASSACQNPSLTYMAVTARAANHAADLLAEGAL